MFFVMWRRWSVGDDDTVIGYLPVDIAKKGPVEPEQKIQRKGLPGTLRRHETDLDREERTLVWAGGIDESEKAHFVTRLFD